MLTFILNNKTIRTKKHPGITLLDFVRYEQRLTGTKIGCREGDCGACTVLVGTLTSNGNVSYQSITSCISPLGNAHGKHIVTVEGTNLEEQLTTAQSAMKAHHASQCGFCTPGFVVSLTGFALSDQEKNQTMALDAISGNICRCTGYKSIERAAHEVCEKLAFSNSGKPLQWLVDHDFIPDYFLAIPARLKTLNTEENIPSGTALVSGGTDLYVQSADELAEKNVHLIFNNKTLKGITIENDSCTIGAGSTVTDLWENTALNTYFPRLKAHLKLVSSEPIRNMASFGGNLINASPIGDMTIFFLALNGKIIITDPQGNTRETALKEFYKAYKTFDLNEGELVKHISFKLPSKNTYFNFEKVCKRTHLDIASVNSAMSITVENGIIEDVHVATGGVAPVPKYLHETVAFLTGKELTHQLILEANEVLQQEIAPISDVRGSSDYKRLLARQLFFAHFTEVFSHQFQLTDLV